jgi:hypothetical protein
VRTGPETGLARRRREARTGRRRREAVPGTLRRKRLRVALLRLPRLLTVSRRRLRSWGRAAALRSGSGIEAGARSGRADVERAALEAIARERLRRVEA